MLSLNSWRAPVVRALVPLGIDIVNDIGGLASDENAAAAAEVGAALVIMHSVGQPKVPHLHVQYPDIMRTLADFFARKMAEAGKAGVSPEAIIIDPGIDFAKQRADNLRIFRELNQLTRLGSPLLLPRSRKTVIGGELNLPDPQELQHGTIG